MSVIKEVENQLVEVTWLKNKKDEEYTGPGKYKKGGSVKAKCKLGRNKPTKLY